MPNLDKDDEMWVEGENGVEVRKDGQPREKPNINSLSLQVRY